MADKRQYEIATPIAPEFQARAASLRAALAQLTAIQTLVDAVIEKLNEALAPSPEETGPTESDSPGF